jgi:hypothetical protein
MYPVLTLDVVEGARREVAPPHDGMTVSPMSRRVMRKGAQLILREDPAAPDPVSAPRTPRPKKTPRGAPPAPKDPPGEEELYRFGDTSRRSASLMFVPVRKGEKPIGALSVQSYQPRAYTQEDLEILQALADHCGGALDRAFSEKRLRAQERLNRALSDLALRLSAAASPAEAAAVILEAADEMFGWDAAYLNLYSEAEDRLESILTFDLLNGRRCAVRPANEGSAPSPMQRRVLEHGPHLLLRQEEETNEPMGLTRFGDESRPSLSLMFTHPSGVGRKMSAFFPSRVTVRRLTVLKTSTGFRFWPITARGRSTAYSPRRARGAANSNCAC